MEAPISQLRELVNLSEGIGTKEITDSFIRLGLTVEHIESTDSQVVDPFVIGHVLSFTEELQKNGKTVRCYRVSVESHNDPANRQYPASQDIICGASNFVVDNLVVVTPPGVVLPGDFRIPTRRTYGRVSDGMIHTEDEIRLDEDHVGIIVIPRSSGLHPGNDILVALWASDEALDIDMTPGLSHGPLLRELGHELAVVSEVPFSDPYDLPPSTPVSDGYPVTLEPDRCSAFVTFAIEGFDPTAPTLRLMADRSRAYRVRFTFLPVDVTNYMMSGSGQPLYTYDVTELQRPIRMGPATEREKIITLDGIRHTFAAGNLLITDDSDPIGIAGIIDGETIEVSVGATTIVLEAAISALISVSHTLR